VNNPEPTQRSPLWSPLTKLAIGLTFIAIMAALLVRFRDIIGPLLVAFVLSYLLHPVVSGLSKLSRLSWRISVNLIFLVVVVIFGGLIAVAGLTIIQQIQSLIIFVRQLITDLPSILADLSTQVYQIGPFQFSMEQYDLQAIANQVLSVVQPILGRMGGLISTFATSAISTFLWSLFVLVIAYFLLVDAGKVPSQLTKVEFPGYDADLRRLGLELRKIWNAYLRGQLTIILMVIVVYSVMLSAFGVRYALGIAILAGMARFVPYLGTFVAWFTLGMVAFFQGYNYFSLEQYQYALLVVGISMLVDQVFDNLISPRVFGDTLGVHPAAVLVAAIVATNLIGVIGLVLAAPVLATINLVSRYVLRKMFDLDPWPEVEGGAVYSRRRWVRGWHRIQAWFRALRHRIRGAL
jgi:predicted PurR-regulated permease PerM